MLLQLQQATPMATTSTTPTTMKTLRQGWEKTCECGFMLRDYNKGEFVAMLNTHLKGTHNTGPLSQADVIAGSKPVRI